MSDDLIIDQRTDLFDQTYPKQIQRTTSGLTLKHLTQAYVEHCWIVRLNPFHALGAPATLLILHRRNLVIDGLKTRQLEGRSFRIGNAVFRYDKPRPPCGYIDQVVGKGMGRALSHNSGTCIRVICGGALAVGDAVVVLDQK